MNNVTTSHYKGNVEFKLVINNEIVTLSRHNLGLPALSRAFCRFLTNNATALNDTPQYLDIKRSSDSWLTSESVLQSRLHFSAREWSYNTSEANYVATFTSSVEYTSFNTDISASDPNSYRLYIQSNNADLAYLDVAAAELAKVTPGVQAIVIWAMQITN